MFNTEHLIWIGLCAVFIAVLTVISKKKNFSLKTAGYIISVICALSEISKIMSNMIESPKGGSLLNPKALPLHLCSLLLFAVLYITFGKDGTLKQTLINFTAVAGILGSVCAILIPTNGTDYTTVPAYQCFVYHSGLLWFSLYLIISKKAELGLKSLGKNMGILMALLLAMIYANSILSEYNTNFMYLVRPPMKNLPFLNLDDGWYAYFLRMLILGAAIVSLFHLPFIMVERKKSKEPPIANTTSAS